jgi:hypothetical protein
MGVLDFLFEGRPPPSTTTYGSTVENMPQWMSDYTQALIARANMVAGEGYQPYQGPRVAGFTDDQTNAFDVIRNNIGNWNDEFDSSKTATGGALTQSMPYFDQAAGATPDQMDRYMDPYVGNVINRAEQVGKRNWDENVMPDLSARFIRGGQSGSTAHMERLARAGRDMSEGLQAQSGAMLSDAYKTAGSPYQQDASRLTDIGKSVGALGLQTGQQLSGLAQMQQSMAGRDATALQAVGDTRQAQNQRNLDLAYGDFREQRDYPRQNVDWMSNIIRGLPHDTTRSTTETGPGDSFQPSPISQLISLYGLYKDVTDKARGGVVHKAEGGKVDKAGALRLLEDAADDINSSGPPKRLGYRKVPEFVDTAFGPWHTGTVKRPPVEGRKPGERRGKFVKRGFHDSKGSDTRYARGGLAVLGY